MFKRLRLWANNTRRSRCGDGKHLVFSFLEYRGEKLVRVKRYCLLCGWGETIQYIGCPRDKEWKP